MKKTQTQFAVESQETLNLFDSEFSNFDFSSADEIKKYKKYDINYHWQEYYEKELTEIFNEVVIEPLKELSAEEKEEAFNKFDANLSPAKNLLNQRVDIEQEALKLKDTLSEKEKYEMATVPLILSMLVTKNIEAMSLFTLKQKPTLQTFLKCLRESRKKVKEDL